MPSGWEEQRDRFAYWDDLFGVKSKVERSLRLYGCPIANILSPAGSDSGGDAIYAEVG